MGKRKVQDKDEEVPFEELAVAKPPAKKRAPKTKKVVEPFDDEYGWHNLPPGLFHRTFGDVKPGSKIAAFDFDGTLCSVKSFAKFAKDSEDYKLFNKKVHLHLKELVEQGYTLVVFSNQGGVKSKLDGVQATKVKQRVANVLRAAAVEPTTPSKRKKAKNDADDEDGDEDGALPAAEPEPLPVTVLCATMEDEFRKPSPGMWNYFVENLNGGVQPDLSKSFFVGDAAGRTGDFSDSDKKFAEAVGIEFKTPEDVFGPGDTKRDLLAGLDKAGAEGQIGNEANEPLAQAFDQMAVLHQDNTFKAVALRRSAKILRAFPDKIESSKQVSGLKGIGKGSIGLINEFLSSGGVIMELQGGGCGSPATKKKDKDAGAGAAGASNMALKFV